MSWSCPTFGSPVNDPRSVGTDPFGAICCEDTTAGIFGGADDDDALGFVTPSSTTAAASEVRWIVSIRAVSVWAASVTSPRLGACLGFRRGFGFTSTFQGPTYLAFSSVYRCLSRRPISRYFSFSSGGRFFNILEMNLAMSVV